MLVYAIMTILAKIGNCKGDRGFRCLPLLFSTVLQEIGLKGLITIPTHFYEEVDRVKAVPIYLGIGQHIGR